MNELDYAIGLISSVTGDRVEAAIIETDGQDEIRSVGGVTARCSEDLHWGLLEATQNDLPTTELLRLEKQLTLHWFEAIELLRERYPHEAAAAKVIGLAGHQLRHLPQEALSLEIGNPWLLSQKTGLEVVTDFRRFDMAIGGQGAPLVAMFHWALMANEPRPALMLNLGAVSSVTWLSTKNEIIAGDVGPGMELLDEWVQEVAEEETDLDGRVSASGEINDEGVRYALEGEFFSRPLPKAVARADFERIDVSGLGVNDGAATICAVIAGAVASAVERLPERPKTLWVTGAGSRHPLILSLLEPSFKEIMNVSQRSLDPESLEAESYAWLAVRHQRGLPITTPETTGCARPSCVVGSP